MFPLRFFAGILGDYLISVHGNPTTCLPSYLGDTFLWEEAETIFFREITQSVSLAVTAVPGPRDPNDRGRISGSFGIETEDDARVDARRRAANVRAHVRRRTTGGRELNDPQYVLIASIATDENGEFDFPNLPPGFYRINFEYPGVPMDQNSFVEFEVTADGDNSAIELAATALDGLITVEQVLPLSVDLIEDVHVYPNPVSNQLKIGYSALKSDGLVARLYDINGRIVKEGILPRSDQNEIVIRASD